MKKKLLITSLAMYSIAVNAQITITSTNMPMAGNSYITATDTAVASYGTAGANQTWDFSTWANHQIDTAEFKVPSGLAGASFFPTSNLGMGDTEEAAFMKNGTSAFEILGSSGDFFGTGISALIFNPAQKIITFPSTYQTTFSGISSYTFAITANQPGLDSVKIKNITSSVSTIDGWGTLSTPAYSNVSTLRQYVTDISIDSSFVLLTGDSVWMAIDISIDTSYSYKWWSNANTYTVAEITFYEGDSIYNGSYLTNTVVGVNELAKNANSVSVFPSPASNNLTFRGIESDSYLLVFDVNGKLVEKTLMKKNTTINVANYNNGVYFYTVAPLNGSAVSKGKFVVEK